MSLFTRALAGAGEQAVVITNKYIDESLAQQRAQAIADIQRNSATQQREDADAFNNDPTRLARNRATAVADVEALGGAKNKVELAGRIAESSDPTITAGLSERAGKIAGATETARVSAQTEATISQLSDPKYIDGLRKKAAAERDPNANAGSLATAALANFQLARAKNVATLQDALTTAIDAGDSKAETAAREKLNALLGKDSKTTEFYRLADSTSKAMAPALKILNDPMATPDAKTEAEQTMREQRALLTAAAKRAGVDLAEASKVPPAQAAKEAQSAVARGASLDEVNKELVAKGYEPLPDPRKKVAPPPSSGSLADQAAAPYQPPADSQVGQWRAKAAARTAASTAQSAKDQQAAAAAYAALPPGDKAAARSLQDSPMFRLLSKEQQTAIYKTVNSR